MLFFGSSKGLNVGALSSSFNGVCMFQGEHLVLWGKDMVTVSNPHFIKSTLCC